MTSTATKLPSRDELMQVLLPLEVQYSAMKVNARVRGDGTVDYDRLDCEDLQERIDLITRRLAQGGYDLKERAAISIPLPVEGTSDTSSER